MKKVISLTLAVLIILFAAPVFAQGADMPVPSVASSPADSGASSDKGLESAIKSAKALLPIPESFTKFEYHLYNENGKEVWNLSWNSEKQEGSAYARIDQKGNILNYSLYKNEDYDAVKKLPKISEADADKIALDFIKKISPNYIDMIKKVDSNDTLNGNRYYITYVEIHNGIQYADGGISVSVNAQTGEVMDYNCTINPDNVFPKPDKIITPEQAEAAYKTELGLRLVYRSVYEENNLRVFLAYEPVYTNDYVIDAFSGKRIQLSDYVGPYYNRMYGMDMAMKSARPSREVELTPAEIDAVKSLSGLISKEDAESKARAMGGDIGLDSNFKLENYSLQRQYPYRDQYNWSLNFRSVGADGKGYTYCWVSLNAKTGELINFSSSRYETYAQDKLAKYGIKDAKDAAEAFIKKYAGDKAAYLEYTDRYSENLPKDGKNPEFYTLWYTRKINGIPYPDNGVNIQYNAVDGKIISYNLTWNDAQFTEPSNVLPLDEIYTKFFTNIGLELQYATSYSTSDSAKAIPYPDGRTGEIKLVYRPDSRKPLLLDPVTGERMGYDGKPFKETQKFEYTDISGHYAEAQIKMLGQMGIGFEQKEFKPDAKLLQKEFLWLISRSTNGYIRPLPLDSADKTELDNMYKMLFSMGIIKEGEEAPDSEVSREDAVKFLIRAMKMENVAKLSGIWACPFSDKDSIDQSLIGYVTLAYGLGIVKGGNGGAFEPKQTLSRAQGAIMIYNLLGRK